MTNEEKYKTPEERQEAFETFCESQRADNMPCSKCCELRKHKGGASCAYLWLTLEAEEDPDNCPCCGGESVVVVRDNPTMTKNVYVRCTLCGMSTSAFNTNAEAIAAWNRRVKCNRHSNS